MPYIPKKVIDELKKIDLYSYFQMTNPNELVSEGNGLYCTKTHDSLKMSNGFWNWFSHGVGGKNAIDFIMEDEQISFIDAVKILMQRTGIRGDNYVQYVPKTIQKFEKRSNR